MHADLKDALAALYRVRTHWLTGERSVDVAEYEVLERALSAVETFGDARSILHIQALLGSEHLATRRRVVRAIEHLMPRRSLELVGLSRAMRHHRGGAFGAKGVSALDSTSPSRLANEAGAKAGTLGALSFGRNGYVREAALMQLRELRDGTELPFLFLRLGDIVPQIRAMAETAISERSVPRHAVAMAQRWGLLETVAKRERFDQSVALRVRTLLTTTTEGRAAVLNELVESVDLDNRRALLKLLLDARPQPAELDTIADVSDEFVRERVLVARIETAADDAVETLVRDGVTSSFPSVRKAAFAVACARARALADELARVLMCDANAWIREYARVHLRNMAVDVPALYRQHLNEHAIPTAGAIAGLAEIGSPADAKLVARFIDIGPANLRRAAVRALVALDASIASPVVVSALASELPSVARTACDMLVRRHVFVPARELEPLLAHPSAHVRRQALRAISGLDKWRGLSAALRVRGDADPNVRRSAEVRLRKWNQSPSELYTQPPADVAAHLREVCDTSPPELAQLIGTLKFMLNW